MRKFEFYALIKILAVAGNGLFILWILYNGIDEGFSAGMVQVVSLIGLVLLLTLNSFLLIRKDPNAGHASDPRQPASR